MATASTPNNRASLLSGLRTGGVRSASQPHQVPHTAAPAGTFNVPRFASVNHPSNPFPEEDEEDDQLANMAAQSLNVNGYLKYGIPMTANAVDSFVNVFHQQQQQQQFLARQHPAQRAAIGNGGIYQTGDHEMQAQMMQMELLKYQALQQAQHAQQYQAELIAAQRQHQPPARSALHRPIMEAMSAAPNVSSFDRANAVAQLRARTLRMDTGEELGPVPMTAAVGGKFAPRTLNPQATSFVMNRFNEQDEDVSAYQPNQAQTSTVPPTPSRTTVISGGTSLGTPVTSSFSILTPSKSDTAVSWRRGSATNNTVLRSPLANTTPSVTRINRASPCNDEFLPTTRPRPQPLRFSTIDSSDLPTVAIEGVNIDEEVASGSSKTDSPTSASSPTTPPSTHSSLSGDAKKPYEGIGVGRPAIAPSVNTRQVSLPSRQPKGPPAGADELGPRNFAARIRRQAIGGLGALVTAREGRDLAVEVQAY